MTLYRFEVSYLVVVPGEVEAVSESDARERIEKRDPSLNTFDPECHEQQIVKFYSPDE